MHIVRTKCMLMLLYGLEACPKHVKSDNNSLDFVVNLFFVKLFRSNNIDVINYCRTQFNFALPSVLIEQRSRKFVVNYRLCDNVFC